MATALRYSGIECGAQGIHTPFADGMAHGVFRRWKGAGGNFSPDLLSSIRC
jgi:hypothetical protein